MSSNQGHIVLGVTGSIAAVKTPDVVRGFKEKGYSVTCVLTKSAEQFVTPLSLATLSGEPTLTQMFDDRSYQMPHLSVSEKATLFLVAPASAGIMARFANGLTDDLISLMYLNTKAPVLMAPAMHPTMWHHSATQNNLRLLQSRGVHFVGPESGLLADETEGDGRMSEPSTILEKAESLLRISSSPR